MTRAQEIRKEALLQLYAARPLNLSPALMARQAKRAGCDFTEREFAAECAFLSGQALATSLTDAVSGETKFAITSAGIILYEKD